LHTEGVQLIDKDQVFDLYPSLGMPGQKKLPDGGIISKRDRKEEDLERLEPRIASHSPESSEA
jgi:hypothetical protein